ncbi:MAG TPA: Fe-S cluster assembly protein SufD [Woeseiaceae bacterium]|nr:Fe-S cluster assembly protein SufD [Woeseiaceae bacterium]
MTAAAIDTDLLEQVVGDLPRDPLAKARREALSRFRQTGFPTPRQEDWKYTNLAPAAELSNRWLRDAAARAPQAVLGPAAAEHARRLTLAVEAHWLVIANGVVDPDSLAAVAGQDLAGLQVTSAAEGAETGSVKGSDAMSLFNTILLRDALHVAIAPGAVLDKPIGVLVFDDAGTAVSQPRIVIEAGDNARAEIVEVHASAGEGGQFANAVTEVTLGAGSALAWVRLQERREEHYQVGRLTVRLGRDASFDHAGFDLGGGLVRNDIAVDIAEPGAYVSLQGLYLAGGRQHIDNHTRVDHRVGPAKSVEEYRGILGDRARCVFNGKALVHEGADGTDAQQANHNLLLSDHAEIDTKPELEIYAEDVKCSHGATVGQLDRNALFYLRTRGLSEEEAAQALMRAFASTIVARAPVAAARDYVERAVATRLQTLLGDTSPESGAVGARIAGDRQRENP